MTTQLLNQDSDLSQGKWSKQGDESGTTGPAQGSNADTAESGGAGDSGDRLLTSPEVAEFMESDVSTTVLLGRLKLSLLTCVEFTKFLRKKYMFEEGHAVELGKTFKNFFPGGGESGLQHSIHKVLEFDGRLAQVKMSYVSALQKIYDELTSLLSSMTKMRKNLKEHGRRLEKEVSDAIHSAEKAKTRYMALCSDWEKLRLVDPSRTKLTLRGSRTTKEQEEELLRKIDAADLDYKQKVDHSTSLRNTYITRERPKMVSELKDLILELDSAITIQLQKYTIWTENLILNSGVIIIPFEGSSLSMKDYASTMRNKQDLYEYLSDYSKKNASYVNKSLIPVDYRKHPAMLKFNCPSTNSNSGPLLTPDQSITYTSNPNTNSNRRILSAGDSLFDLPSPSSIKYNNNGSLSKNTNDSLRSPGGADLAHNGSEQGTGLDVLKSPGSGRESGNPNDGPGSRNKKDFGTLDPGSRNSAIVLNRQSSVTNSMVTVLTAERPLSMVDKQLTPTSDSLSGENGGAINSGSTSTTKNPKTFGVALEELLDYEQDLVPAIVRQCIYIVDKYGLTLEGIYRRCANVLDVSKFKEDIDKDPANIAKLLPPKNYTDSDIYLAGSLLKTFFSSLPDPLLPRSMSDDIKTCLTIDNTTTRKNYLHGLIYKLPDCRYWTLRALLFHLKRVAEHEKDNRMNMKSLCIIWGPTIVPPNQSNINDVNHQISAMEVLFDVAEQAFEPE